MAGDNSDNSGGAGGEQTPPPPVPSMTDVMAKLDMVVKQNETLRTENAQLAQVLQQRLAPRQQEQEEEPELVDEDVVKVVEKRVAKMLEPLSQQITYQHQQTEEMEFNRLASEANLSEEEVARVKQTHRMWANNGVTINGRPPVLRDVASQLYGAVTLQDRAKNRDKARDAEAARRAGNEGAELSRGGRSAPDVKGLGDPEKMSRKDRLEKYWPAKLDNEPW